MEIKVGDLVHNPSWGDHVPPIEVVDIRHIEGSCRRVYYSLKNISEHHAVESITDAWYNMYSFQQWTIIKKNNLKNIKGYAYEDRRQSAVGRLP